MIRVIRGVRARMVRGMILEGEIKKTRSLGEIMIVRMGVGIIRISRIGG